MLTQDAFVQSVEAYLQRTGMTATAFGIAAINDRTFVFELRRGRSPSLKVVERVLAFIERGQSEQAPAPEAA